MGNKLTEELLKGLAQEAQRLFPAPPLEDAPLYTRRKPLGKQKEAIDALYSAFRRGERLLILSGKEGEGIGVGKTYVSIATSMALLHPKGRVLVICPPHIVKKWAKEVREDGGTPLLVRGVGEFLEVVRRPPEGLEYVILSKDQAKRRAERVLGVYRSPRGVFCPHCHAPLGELKGREKSCPVCGEVLLQPKGKPGLGDVLGRFIKEFDFLILDEAHVFRSMDTLQGRMAQSLMARIPTLLLSGSLMGGFVGDLYPILRKAFPHVLGDMTLEKFVDTYGVKMRVERRYYTPRRIYSRAFEKPAPGFAPHLLSLVIPKSYFLGLKEVGELPPYREKVHIFPLTPEQEAYLGGIHKIGKKKGNEREYLASLAYAAAFLGLDVPGVERIFVGGESYSVPPIPTRGLLPKEAMLLLLARMAQKEGRKMLVFVEGTGTWDVQTRLWTVLRDDGHQPLILTREIPPERRMEFIERRDPSILIVNPRLVETGLDLVDYSVAVFYQPPRSAFSLRQASRRIYRLGQKKEVFIHYFAYKGIQESLLAWVAERVRQSTLFEGGYNESADLFPGMDPMEVALKAFLGEVRKVQGEAILGFQGGREKKEEAGAEGPWPTLSKERVVRVGRQKILLPAGQVVLFDLEEEG